MTDYIVRLATSKLLLYIQLFCYLKEEFTDDVFMWTTPHPTEGHEIIFPMTRVQKRSYLVLQTNTH